MGRRPSLLCRSSLLGRGRLSVSPFGRADAGCWSCQCGCKQAIEQLTGESNIGLFQQHARKRTKCRRVCSGISIFAFDRAVRWRRCELRHGFEMTRRVRSCFLAQEDTDSLLG